MSPGDFHEWDDKERSEKSDNPVFSAPEVGAPNTPEIAVETGEVEGEAIPVSPHSTKRLDTKIVLRFLKEKHNLTRKFCDFICFVPFILILSTLVILTVPDAAPYFFNTSIRQQVREFELPGGTVKSFLEIEDQGEFWQWVFAKGSLQSLWGDPQQWNYFPNGNKLVGGIVRFSQLRVKPDNCDGFEEWLPNDSTDLGLYRHKQCLPEFSISNEFNLPRHDINRCLTLNPQTPYESDTEMRTGWRWTKLDLLGSGRTKITPASTYGEFHDYNTDEIYSFDTYTYHDWDQTERFLQCMQRNNWVDNSTRFIMVSFIVYNPENDNVQLTLFQFFIEIDHYGGYYPSEDVYTMILSGFPSGRHILQLIATCYLAYFFLLIVLDFSAKLIPTLKHIRRGHNLTLKQKFSKVAGKFFAIVFSWWRLLDMALVVSWITALVLHVPFWNDEDVVLSFDYSRENPSQEWVNDKIPSTLTGDARVAAQRWWYDYDLFLRLESLCIYDDFIQRAILFTVVISYMRLFKFIRLSMHVAIISDTIRKFRTPLIAVLICIFVIATGFATAGVGLYGAQALEFSDMKNAYITLFLVALGSFEYDKLQRVNRNWTFAFFFIYNLFVWLVLLNLVVAMAVSAWNRSKERWAAVFTAYRHRGLNHKIRKYFYVPEHFGKGRKQHITWGRLGGFSHGIWLFSLIGKLSEWTDQKHRKGEPWDHITHEQFVKELPWNQKDKDKGLPTTIWNRLVEIFKFETRDPKHSDPDLTLVMAANGDPRKYSGILDPEDDKLEFEDGSTVSLIEGEDEVGSRLYVGEEFTPPNTPFMSLQGGNKNMTAKGQAATLSHIDARVDQLQGQVEVLASLMADVSAKTAIMSKSFDRMTRFMNTAGDVDVTVTHDGERFM